MLVSAPTGAKPAQEDSGHWYTRDGAPAYRQVTRAGGFRGTDIRDAKRLGLTPSVTTVLSLLAKPALTNWMVDQGILAALTLPRAPGEPEEAFLRRVKEDSRAQGKAAAEEGSRIHDACEMSMKGREFPPRYIQHVLGASNKLRELFPNVTDWIAEQSFAHESGYGGKVDLHSPSTGIVVDYKTTDEREGSEKRFHWDQNWQLGAYQTGLNLPLAPCANIFVSRSQPGAVFAHVWTENEVAHGREVFAATLATWKAIKGWDSSFVHQSATS